tara:strand:- start:303 stop:2678 length:2376 start_codon:yes stop_codon:yes gene_type:complete
MKILSAETNLASATNVSNATVVRIFNSDESHLTVTRKIAGGSTIGTLIVPSGKVVYCEKDSTDTLEGGSNLKVAKTAYSSMMSFASSGSSGPTYFFSLSTTSINEGGSFTTTVTTTNVDDGTTLYWELSGTGITSGDFSSGALTGSGTVNSGTFNFSHTLAEDATTEGTETIDIKLYTDSGRNTQVGNTVNVNVNDTSLTPTYAATPVSSTVDEGSSLTINITTTNVADSTTLYWGLTNSGDFGTSQGTVTISSNSATVSVGPTADSTTEGNETFELKLYTDSGRSVLVASTGSITIVDTSIAPVMNTTGLEHWWDFNDDAYVTKDDGNRGSIVTATNNWLSVGPSSDLTMGTGDFTIECWVFKYSNNHKGVFQITTNTNGLQQTDYGDTIAVGYQVNRWQLYGSNGSGNINGALDGPTPPTDGNPAGNWTHLALVRNGSSLKLFVNGYQEISTTTTKNFQGNYLSIGGYYNTSYLMNGRVSNFKITKGEALYTSAFDGNTPNFPVTKKSCGSDPDNVVLIGCRNESNMLNFEVIQSGASVTSQTNGGSPVNAGGADTDGFTSGTKSYAVDIAGQGSNGFCGLYTNGGSDGHTLQGNVNRRSVYKSNSTFYQMTNELRVGNTTDSMGSAFTFFYSFLTYTNPWINSGVGGLNFASNNDGNNYIRLYNTNQFNHLGVTKFEFENDAGTVSSYEHSSGAVYSGGPMWIVYWTFSSTGVLKAYVNGNLLSGGTTSGNSSWSSQAAVFNFIDRVNGSTGTSYRQEIFGGFYNRELSASEISSNYAYHTTRMPTHL